MPAQQVATSAGFAPMTGPFLLAALATVAALGAAIGTPSVRPTRTAQPGRPPLFRMRAVRSAAATMVSAQVVMVAVMTAAPLSMHMHGAHLSAIGTMLSAHTLGMFALAPVSGWLVDRAGAHVVMAAGLLTLAGSAGFVATAPSGLALTGSLFLLGYGWNLAIVGGSGLLARRLHGSEAARAQGTVEALSWGTSTIASTASTLMFVHGGYPMLSLGADLVALLPLSTLAAAPPRYAPGVQRSVSTGDFADRPAAASSLISLSVRAKPVSDESSAVANTMPSTVPAGEINGPPELPLRTIERIE
jgi:MFS family permease